jgi:hypothetical protein
MPKLRHRFPHDPPVVLRRRLADLWLGPELSSAATGRRPNLSDKAGCAESATGGRVGLIDRVGWEQKLLSPFPLSSEAEERGMKLCWVYPGWRSRTRWASEQQARTTLPFAAPRSLPMLAPFIPAGGSLAGSCHISVSPFSGALSA